jgi:hypothetical protein
MTRETVTTCDLCGVVIKEAVFEIPVDRKVKYACSPEHIDMLRRRGEQLR